MGYHFLRVRLLALWKLIRKLDFIDLQKEFYLIWFGLKEDYSEVLEKGLWFIEHFLSIRLWEPNFKPSSVNVSCIAIWVRLSKLPIEYYELEILKQIGKSICHVLKINTYTAAETRGRYARLCIQVDIEKPLTTLIILRGWEQSISYKGIHKLCFTCDQIGHWREDYPYLIHVALLTGRVIAKKENGADRTACWCITRWFLY